MEYDCAVAHNNTLYVSLHRHCSRLSQMPYVWMSVSTVIVQEQRRDGRDGLVVRREPRAIDPPDLGISGRDVVQWQR